MNSPNILFIGDDSEFETALSNSTLNFNWEMFQLSFRSDSHSSYVNSFQRLVGIKRWREATALRNKLINDNIAHVHCLSPDLVDSELLGELGLTYSVSCSSNPFQGEVDEVTIARAAALRQAEFVLCNSEWLKQAVVEATGIDSGRVYFAAWPISFKLSGGDSSVPRQGVVILSDEFSEIGSELDLLEKLDSICQRERAIIITTKAWSIESPSHFEWLKLQDSAHLLPEYFVAARLGIVDNPDDLAIPVLTRMLFAGLPVVASHRSPWQGLVVDSVTGVVTGSEDLELAKATQLLLMANHRLAAMSDGAKSYAAQAVGAQDSVNSLGVLIEKIFHNPAKRSRTVIDLIDGIDIGRRTSETAEN